VCRNIDRERNPGYDRRISKARIGAGMTWRRVPTVAVLSLLLVGLSRAQTPRVVSPEVLSDRRVIVRFYAPQAREVGILFERGGNSLSKHENGFWEATLGP